MDDFKRAIYIEARNGLVQGRFGYMCNELKYGFCVVTGEDWYLTNEEMDYFFPELFAQFDKKYWSHVPAIETDERTWRYESDPHTVWMNESFVTERLALLDLLIDERL